MSELRTDEEQVEMLKNWWAENGKSLLISVVLVAGSWVGWNYYQDQQRHNGEAAAALYGTLSEKTAAVSENSANTAARTEAVAIAEELKKNYAGSQYAQFASLYLARLAADAGDMASASNELRDLLKTAQPPVSFMATVRLATVLVEQGQFDDALALVNTTPDVAYNAQYLEVRGDALLLKGDKTAARKAYLDAVEAARLQGSETQSLQRKADFLVAAEGN
ncbi:YfgM family protein [Parathalassolituus penaei]|uniref:Ancillary SecYEG translocon subunit n=1 Tax=Parathalassolituus penaei TaxID=2997323 RepID=A0A9X3IV97_9GAMM|nr:tetratricopeptide repeat protein [Parathalassolituus penaei]MCY0967028.1 tetratricopeptide repeat protein [Parathalassolituus penaei]